VGSPSCSPYRCVGSSASCPTSCSGSSSCASGYTCQNGSCETCLTVGMACAGSTANRCCSGSCFNFQCQ
jgi:hypothetical protein